MLRHLAAIALLLAVIVACSDDPAPTPTLSPTPSEPTPTEEPTQFPPRPATTFAPGPSTTPAATPTAAPTVSAQGTQTGIAGIDSVIRAVLNRDAAALAAQMPLQEVGCTNAQGLGGPPSCPPVTLGYAPEGTPVRSFPYGACEGAWTEDVLGLAERLLEQSPRLYGVVQLRFATPLIDVAYLLRADAGVILEVDGPPSRERLGIMLMMQGSNVVYITHYCFGPPEGFLQDDPFRRSFILILRGPAYRDP